MYNNTIIKTNYKPYIPPPKKKVDKDAEQKQPQVQKQVVTPNNYSEANNHQKPAGDTFNKIPVNHAKININQVLIDFRSTINAIGATEDIEKEVITYLGLVETQSQKPNPNKKMIVSNLKIAADILDGYITETLNKPSKVVKDWIDALLLQNVDFKADANVTKGAFESITGEPPQTEALAKKKLEQKSQVQEIVPQEPVVSNAEIIEVEPVVVEEKETTPVVNTELVSLLENVDKYLNTSPKKALDNLSRAFTIAQSSSDKATMSEIYSKIGQVHNSINNLPQALECLHASTALAYSLGNDLLKTQNHKQMGKIYDEAGYMDTALSHYYASLGIDENLEDTDNQADTLNSIGMMYTVRYIEDDAVDYYKDALELAKVTKNLDMMSNIFQNTALTFKNAGHNDKAINNYKQAALLSQKSGNKEDLAEIYEKAADLMVGMNYSKRAVDLYKKSYRLAQQQDNQEVLARLRNKLVEVA